MSTTSLETYTQSDLVSIMATKFAAQSNTEVRDDAGEPLGDIWASIALCVQIISQNLIYVNNKSRLNTSGNASGSFPDLEYSPDVDSFVNVFSVYRTPATPSSGTVLFTPPSIAGDDQYILPGTKVTTNTGLQFVVVASASYASYTASGYLVPAGTNDAVEVAVQCTIDGVVGNIEANSITALVSGLGGTAPLSQYAVTNPQSFIDGTTGEKDAPLIARFQAEFLSGRFATRLAILTAIAGVQANLTYQIHEGYNLATARDGWFTVYVNIVGANGAAPDSLLNAVRVALDRVKALGISYAVASPTLQIVPVAATIIPDPAWLLIPGNTKPVLRANVEAAFDSYVNTIGLNANGTSTLLSAAKVSAILVSVPGVQNISGYTLNGANLDLTAPFGTQFIAGTATLTVA